MTPDERFERIERQLEFLASHQAQLSSALERLSANLAQVTEDLKRVTEIVGSHTEQIGQLIDLVMRFGRVVEEQGRSTYDRLDRLVDAQVRTDQRLNLLIGVVERFLSNGRR